MPSASSLHAPTEVNRGRALISMRQPWSSVRCQCSTFMPCNASKSTCFLTKSKSWKCRQPSKSNPRCSKKGASTTDMAGNTNPSGQPDSHSTGSILRKVIQPLNNPAPVAASTTTPLLSTFRRYASAPSTSSVLENRMVEGDWGSMAMPAFSSQRDTTSCSASQSSGQMTWRLP